MELFWIAGAGALGALLRFELSRLCHHYFPHFPVGTLLVNVLGAFLMGALSGAIRAGLIPALLWTDIVPKGFLGALTTFSTFSMDNLAALQAGKPARAALNIALNLILGLAATGLGFWLLSSAR